jgi:hypothetical protein
MVYPTSVTSGSKTTLPTAIASFLHNLTGHYLSIMFIFWLEKRPDFRKNALYCIVDLFDQAYLT